MPRTQILHISSVMDNSPLLFYMGDMKQLIVHLGAHRCASSATQALLRNNRARLLAGGVELFLRTDMQAGRAGVDARFLPRFQAWNPVSQWRLRQVGLALDALPEDRIILSEENLVGPMPGQQGPGFYLGFAQAAEALNRLGRGIELAARMIVRRQDRLIESAYAFRVAFGYKQDFATFLLVAARHQPSWTRLADEADQAGLGDRMRFLVLESLPAAGAASHISQFLGVGDLTARTGALNGNASFGVRALSLLLAMNRLGMAPDMLWRRRELFPLLRQAGDAVTPDILAQAGYPLDRAGRTALLQVAAAAPRFHLLADERNRLMAGLLADNQAFLARSNVAGGAGVWDMAA